MPDLHYKDFAYLLNIVDAIDKIKRYTAPFENADAMYVDKKSFDAVLMNFWL